jgi:hypothetical protein
MAYEEFIDTKRRNPKGVILGSSAVFGVGATHDRHTIPSLLNRNTETEWFNYGGRAFNSTQEVLLYLLHLVPHIKKMVIFSGVNNLTLSYLSHKTSAIYNSLFGERAMQLSGDIGIRQSIQCLLGAIRKKIISRPSIRRNISGQYENIISCFRRDIEILRGLSKTYGFELYFVLQPIATWIDKVLSDEEKNIFSILDQMSMDWLVLSEYISEYRDVYKNDLLEICARGGIPFYDMNTSNQFSQKEWLFVDRVHLTDMGYQLSANIIKREFNL